MKISYFATTQNAINQGEAKWTTTVPKKMMLYMVRLDGTYLVLSPSRQKMIDLNKYWSKLK